jgi:sugar phosphate isomerase/epimerase
MDYAAVLHSISYSGSWGQVSLTVPEFVRKAAELGFDGVLLAAKRPHVSILDYGAKERAALRSEIEKAGLGTVILAGYNNFTADLDHADVPTLEIQTAYVIELARLARDIGAGLVRVFTGYEHPASSYNAQWDMVVRALRECARRAAEWNVVIGVQNHHDLACGYESQCDLIRAVGEPNCLALFDAWAPALHGADLQEAAQVMAPITAHTTIANYVKRPRYRYRPELVNYEPLTPVVRAAPIDEGFIDYGAFLEALREGGFRGSVAYEMCSPLEGGGSMENLDACARRFIEFMRRFRAR